MTITSSPNSTHIATRNACQVCAPLGASLAFAGVANALPYLHGGQGCSTYIRRYTISHFREPIDIASSSFGEEATVFGGRKNLFAGLSNVIRQYQPDLIGIASTCLSETIGENVLAHIKEFRQEFGPGCPEIVFASTPSYRGSQYEGFHKAVQALVSSLAGGETEYSRINILPGMLSPQDIRCLKQICADFGISAAILPDYSDTLDGETWEQYRRLPDGGTPLAAIKNMNKSAASLDFSRFSDPAWSAGLYLQQQFELPDHRLGIPVGVRATDELMALFSRYADKPLPEKYRRERGRLLDAYVDGHKYVFGRRVLVYGDPDFSVSLGLFLAEIGMVPLMCISGPNYHLADKLAGLFSREAEYSIYESLDFEDVTEIARRNEAQLMIGSSKGYPLARSLKIPLVRLGFPVHDRFGATRLGCLGYRGTQELFDRIVNAILTWQQDNSPTGSAYL